ncbi:hypothetical protein FALBO_5432 [Fusarium albosuccineum]|uniref:Uncharacterized protein n=1 Tax=Fusarium albosuccineum TaxID=1237068 RepID=A0A8H4LGN4_9HYPO|nr:hypothetical protein FALBO_5432 [Fusarium albosuccineum]
MGAAESKPPRSSVSARRRGGGQGGPKGPGKAADVVQQLVEIPLNLEAFLQAKAAQSETPVVDAGTMAVSDAGDAVVDDGAENQEPKVEEEGTRPAIPTVQVHLNGVSRALRTSDWSKPLQRFIKRLELGPDASALSVIYDKDLENVGIKPPEESEGKSGPISPAKFSSHVYKFLGRQCRGTSADDTKHLYFLYHPDSDWHADFADLLQDRPLPDNFLGFSENMDALVAWMKFIRARLGKRTDAAMFHLLIPTYRPMSIRDALEFPDLGDLAIHGETHNSNNYVWVNLPTHDSYPGNLLLKDVENTIREESEWKTAATVGTALGGVSASLAGAAFTLSAAFPPLAVLGIGGVCSTIAAMQVNRGLSKEVPRVLGGTETPKEPKEPKAKAEPEKEDSAASEQEEPKEEPAKAKETPVKSKDEAKVKEEVKPKEEVVKPRDDSDAQSVMSKASSSKKHRRSDRKRSHK